MDTFQAVVLLSKVTLRNCLNQELELGKNIIEKKKGLKLTKLIFYLTGKKLQTVVKTVLVNIKFYSPDTFQTPLYAPLAWTMC